MEHGGGERQVRCRAADVAGTRSGSELAEVGTGRPPTAGLI